MPELQVVNVEQELDEAKTIDDVTRALGIATQSELFAELGIPPRDPAKSLAGEFPPDYLLHLFGFELSPELDNVPGYIFNDTTYRLGLVRKGLERYLELAVVGFEIHGKTFAIEQIQAKAQSYYHAGHWGELPFDMRSVLPPRWAAGMLRSAVRFAQDVGMSCVTLIPAEEHPSYKRPSHISDDDVPALRERMRLRYNILAERNGFKREGDLYVREV